MTQIVRLEGEANFAVFGEVTGVHMRDDCLVDGIFDTGEAVFVEPGRIDRRHPRCPDSLDHGRLILASFEICQNPGSVLQARNRIGVVAETNGAEIDQSADFRARDFFDRTFQNLLGARDVGFH